MGRCTGVPGAERKGLWGGRSQAGFPEEAAPCSRRKGHTAQRQMTCLAGWEDTGERPGEDSAPSQSPACHLLSSGEGAKAGQPLCPSKCLCSLGNSGCDLLVAASEGA